MTRAPSPGLGFPRCRGLGSLLSTAVLLAGGPAACASPTSSPSPTSQVTVTDAAGAATNDAGSDAPPAKDTDATADAGRAAEADASDTCAPGTPAACVDGYTAVKTCDPATKTWKIQKCASYCIINKSVSECDALPDTGGAADAADLSDTFDAGKSSDAVGTSDGAPTDASADASQPMTDVLGGLVCKADAAFPKGTCAAYTQMPKCSHKHDIAKCAAACEEPAAPLTKECWFLVCALKANMCDNEEPDDTTIMACMTQCGWWP